AQLGQTDLDLFRHCRTTEDTEEYLIDQPGVVLLGRHEFSKTVFIVGNGSFDGWAADQCHDRPELQSARTLAFANALPRRPAKAREESVRQVDARIGNRRG